MDVVFPHQVAVDGRMAVEAELLLQLGVSVQGCVVRIDRKPRIDFRCEA